MDPINRQRPDLTLLRERSYEARDLLAPGGVFASAVVDLNRRYSAELKAMAFDQGAQNLIVAKIKVIDDIEAEIRKAMTDYLVEARKQGVRPGG